MKTLIVNFTLLHAKKDQTDPSIYTSLNIEVKVVQCDLAILYGLTHHTSTQHVTQNVTGPAGREIPRIYWSYIVFL